jgi:hypothetical protein
MGRNDSIHVRVSPAEKADLSAAAEAAGMTLSEFMRRAAKNVSSKALQGDEPARRRAVRLPQRDPQDRSPLEIPPFRLPFVRGFEGYGFESAVRFAARRMRTDDCTMARAATFLGEGIASAMMRGIVVRWPGLFVAGPYAAMSKTTGEQRVWPRFQANPPLSRDVDEHCPLDLAQNEQLDAHRRRSRRKGVQGVREVMETTRQAITNQDVRALRMIDDYWRDESPAHAI